MVWCSPILGCTTQLFRAGRSARSAAFELLEHRPAPNIAPWVARFFANADNRRLAAGGLLPPAQPGFYGPGVDGPHPLAVTTPCRWTTSRQSPRRHLRLMSLLVLWQRHQVTAGLTAGLGGCQDGYDSAFVSAGVRHGLALLSAAQAAEMGRGTMHRALARR